MLRLHGLALAALLALAFVLTFAPAHAADPTPAAAAPTPQGSLVIPAAARPGPDFDVERATRAWLDTLPADQRARSDAYYEGGYWLRLWGLAYALGVAALLLFGRISAGVRARIERITRRRPLQTFLYGAAYSVLVALLYLPLSFYESYLREHQYGMSTQSLAGWAGDEGKGLLIGALFTGLGVMAIYAVVRRRQGNWWLPATVVATLLLFASVVIAPVFVAPVFNDYHALPPGPVRDSVLSLARANSVPADDVFWFDASRQTRRISANVSGFGGTMRISLNDNLLRDTTLPEIDAVMAHELGHYVLNHVLKMLVFFGLVLGVGFALAQWAQHRLLARWGARWGVRDAADPAGLPLIVALLSLWFFVATPLTNSFIRMHEQEADVFGLNAAREPHAFAAVAMRLSSYRKIEPGRLEEIVFYDHPSGRTRVRTAMQWAKEHPDAGAAARP